MPAAGIALEIAGQVIGSTDADGSFDVCVLSRDENCQRRSPVGTVRMVVIRDQADQRESNHEQPDEEDPFGGQRRNMCGAVADVVSKVHAVLGVSEDVGHHVCVPRDA